MAGSNSAPIVDRIRIIPRPDDFLDRNVGSSGEVFFNRESNSLRVYSGKDRGGFEVAKTDLTNISDADFLAKGLAAGLGTDSGGGSGGGEPGGDTSASITVDSTAPTEPTIGQLWFDTNTGVLFVYYDSSWIQPSSAFAGGGGGTSDSFGTINISGGNTLTATGEDTLTLVAGSNISISSDTNTNTITISATVSESGVTPNSFASINVSGQNSVVADSDVDVLTLAAGSGIVITTNQDTDTITFSAPTSGNFSGLSDASTASLTIDKIYMQAIARITVDNSGTIAYTFPSHYGGNNPTIYAISGTTIAFDLDNIAGHPFELQDATLTALDENITHVAADGTVSTGGSAQGKDSGTLYWTIPESGNGTYVYQCQTHAAMYGTISVKRLATL